MSRPTVILSILALVCAMTLGLCLPVFASGAPMGADLSTHLSEIAGIVRALRAHDFGLWNESANLGFPSGYYYPILPQLVPALAAIAVPSLSLLTWFKLAIVLPLALLPATVYRALCVVDTAAWRAVAAAAGVALVSGPSPWGLGIDSMFGNGLYAQAWGMLFYPLAVAYGAEWLLRGRQLARAVIYALLVGLCHPLFAVALVPALAVVPWWKNGHALALRRGVVLAAGTLAVSAFFWLPILVHFSSFGGFPARAAGETGIPARTLLTLLARGDLLDAGRAPLLTALLIPAAIIAYRRTSTARALWAQALAFAAFLTLGAVVGPIWQDLVPGVRMIAPLQLALGALAGLGAAESLRAGLFGDHAAPRAIRVAIGAAALAAITVVAVGARRVAGARAKTIEDLPEMYPRELGELLDVFKTLPPGRIVSTSIKGSSHWYNALPYVYADKPAARAYGAAALQSSANYIYVMQFPVCAHGPLYGARWLLTDRDKESECQEARVVHRTEHFSLLELPGAGLFAPIQVVGSTRAERNVHRQDSFTWLQSLRPGHAEHLTVGDDSGVRFAAEGHVLDESSGPSRYAAAVAVDGATPTTFMLKVTWHPGWRATVDGIAVDTRRVTPDFLAVDVPPGEHRIRFVFSRPGWTWALLFIDLGLVSALALFAPLDARRHRRLLVPRLSVAQA